VTSPKINYKIKKNKSFYGNFFYLAQKFKICCALVQILCNVFILPPGFRPLESDTPHPQLRLWQK
jgi:hypothetical protein